MGSAMCQCQIERGDPKWQPPSPHYRASIESLSWRRPRSNPKIIYSTGASCKNNSTVKNITYWDTFDSPRLYRDGIHSASSCDLPCMRDEVLAKSFRYPVGGKAANVRSYIAAMNDIAVQSETKGSRIEYDKRSGSKRNLITDGAWSEHSHNQVLLDSPLSKESGTSLTMTSWDGLEQTDAGMLQQKWKNFDVICDKSSSNCIPEADLRDSHEKMSRKDKQSSTASYSDSYWVEEDKDFNIRFGSRSYRLRYEPKNGDKKHRRTQEKTEEGSQHSENSSELSDLESYDSEWRGNSADHSISDDLSSSRDESGSTANIVEKTSTDVDEDSVGTSSSISWAHFKDRIKMFNKKDEKSSVIRFEHESSKISATNHDWSKASQKKFEVLDKSLAKDKTDSASISSSITWDDILKYKQSLQCRKHGISHEEEQLKKLKLDADNGDRICWKTGKNGRRTTPDGVETKYLKSLIRTIQRTRKEDSQSQPFTSSTNSKINLEVQLLYPRVKPDQEEKIIYEKRAPMYEWSGSKTLALSAQRSSKQASPDTTFLPKNFTKETFLSRTCLRVNKCFAANPNTAASPSSCRETRTVLDGSNKILTDMTKVMGDEQTKNKKLYNQELTKLRPKTQFLGQTFALRRKDELNQDGVNAKDQVCTKDGAHMRYNVIVNARTCDFSGKNIQVISQESDTE